MSVPAKLSAVTLDCPDPAALGAFYTAVTGWEAIYSDDDYVYLGADGAAVSLGLQRVPDQAAPGWPGPAKQIHLDFAVDDLAAAERTLVGLGAVKPDFQPGGDKWTVLLDPAGHPFCITIAS